MITLQVDKESEDQLRRAFGEGLDRVALEALAAEGYRRGSFGIGVVRRLLGLDNRWDAEAWLATRGIRMNYSVGDLEADRGTGDRLIDRPSS